MLYFDNNATTQLDPLVLQVMLPFLQDQYGNPSSAYSFGRVAAKAVATAREQVAALPVTGPQHFVVPVGRFPPLALSRIGAVENRDESGFQPFSLLVE